MNTYEKLIVPVKWKRTVSIDFKSDYTLFSSQKKAIRVALAATFTVLLTATAAMASGSTLYTQGEDTSLSTLDVSGKTEILTSLYTRTEEPSQAINSPDVGGKTKAFTGDLSQLARHTPPRSSSNAVSKATNHMTLDEGPLLLSPTENTSVQTRYGTVSIDKGSVLLLVVTNLELAVYNLHDNHKNAVVIDYGSGHVSVSPNRVAVIADSSIDTFSEANPAPFVAYRHVRAEDVGELKLYQAEFDFISLTRGLPALQQLLAENGPNQKTMERMLKTAAIMTQFSQGGESYLYYVTDKVMLLSATASK